MQIAAVTTLGLEGENTSTITDDSVYATRSSPSYTYYCGVRDAPELLWKGLPDTHAHNRMMLLVLHALPGSLTRPH